MSTLEDKQMKVILDSDWQPIPENVKTHLKALGLLRGTEPPVCANPPTEIDPEAVYEQEERISIQLEGKL